MSGVTHETVCFLDIETTGLLDFHEPWEVALITPDGRGHVWQLPVDLGLADSKALEINGYHERADYSLRSNLRDFAVDFAELTRGMHLCGAIVSFDEERLRKVLRANGACPEWSHRLLCVESMAAGKTGVLPDGLTNIARRLGIDPDQFERHTAMGDAQLAKAIYEAVMS